MNNGVEHLSQQELESYLWGAAKLLRGLIDAGDYKQYHSCPNCVEGG
jgi:type I restriction enzyme M protein